jgi:tRNA C32,U32 (ribose-2'-O)-methylase TrmJ
MNLQSSHIEEKEELMTQISQVQNTKPKWEQAMQIKMQELLAKSATSQQEIDALKQAR